MSTSQMSNRMANERGSAAAGALALIGGLLAVASVLLPWASLSIAEIEGIPGVGQSESFNGWTFSDGKVLVILGALVVLMGFILIAKRLSGGPKAVAIGTIVLSLAMLGVAAYDIVQIKDTTADKIGTEMRKEIDANAAAIPPEQLAAVDDLVNQIIEGIQVSVGIGLYIALVGGVLGIAGGAMGLKGGSGEAAGAPATAAPTSASVASPLPEQPAAAPAPPTAAPPVPPTPEAPSPPPASEQGPAQP